MNQPMAGVVTSFTLDAVAFHLSFVLGANILHCKITM